MPPQDLKAGIFIMQFECIDKYDPFMIVHHCVQGRFINYSIRFCWPIVRAANNILL